MLFAWLAATGLGLAVALSRYAYEGGTNGLTVASIRAVLMLLLLLFICLSSRRRLKIAWRDWLHCAGLGVLMVQMIYGNIGSVEFISIGLAALLFYTFPPMIALIHAVVLRERLPGLKILAMIIAFCGLALMLGVSLVADSDWRGVLLALGAAVATAWNAVWLVRKVPRLDPLVISFHMASIAVPLMLLLTLGTNSWQWPQTTAGWSGMMAVAVLQAISMPFYFAAISAIGALSTAMVTNLQPLVSIVAALYLFNEVLSSLQLVGGIMVLSGIFVAQWYDRSAALSLRSHDDSPTVIQRQ